jgi:UDP-3-O-[3-hydroxymyristoyl] glucosamine N-acyltransferase
LGQGVRLGKDCSIGTYAVLEDYATLGDRCQIGPHAVVHRGTTLGDRVVLKAGARVGSLGFRFVAGPQGHERVPHRGKCIVESDVEVGANSTVDRGVLDDTVVGRGTKIDNLVQIGHNVRIGARCVIMGQVGIGGSTIVEDDVMLGGQAGLAGHLTVGREARVAAQAGVIGDVPAGTTVSGYPARSHRTVLRQTAALSRLAPLMNQLERLIRNQ